jgi:hypothetical protein
MPKKLWNIRRYLVEIKIGTFFIVALFLLFIALVSMREVKFLKGTYLLKVKFDFAEGLRASSPVRFCGVDVGEIKDIAVIEENGRPRVMLYAKVQKGVHIPKGSLFFINSLSLFGEKYLEITPPEEKKDGYIGEGEVVEGISPIPLFNVFASFHKTMREISEFVKEGKIKTSIENTVVNLEEITLEVKELIKDIKNKEGTVGRLIYDDSLYEKTEEFIEDIKLHPWKLLHKPKEGRKKR